MAAFVFPLVVKLHLVQEGHYSLSSEDEVHCRSVDALLSLVNWADENGSSIHTKWQNTITAQKRASRIDAAVRKTVQNLEAKGLLKLPPSR